MNKYAHNKAADEMPKDPTLFEYLHHVDLKQLDEMGGVLIHSFYEDLFEPQANKECQGYKWKKTAINEKPEQVIEWPYAQRIIYLAKKFERISPTDRNYIIRLRKEGIFWRGDDVIMFRAIVDEIKKYRRLDPLKKGQYKRDVMKEAKRRRL